MRGSILAAVCVWFVACAASAPTSVDEPAAPPSGLGGVSVAINAVPSAVQGLTSVLVLDRTGPAGKEKTGVVTRTRPLGETYGVVDIVYIDPGVYTVTLSLQDTWGEVVLSGSATNIVVIQGEITGVTIPLTSAGGVQITAEILSGGADWTFAEVVEEGGKPVPANGYKWSSLTGAQRVVKGPTGQGQVEYALFGVLMPEPPTPNERLSVFLLAASPADLMKTKGDALLALALSQKAAGLSTCSQPSLTSAGGHYYLTCTGTSLTLYRTPDGATWEKVFSSSSAPALTGAGVQQDALGTLPIVYDTIAGCVMVVDTQYNLFCTARRPVFTWVVINGKQVTQLSSSSHVYLLHAFSPNGLYWSDLFTYDVAAVKPEDKVFPDNANSKLYKFGKLPPLKDGSLLALSPDLPSNVKSHILLDGGALRHWYYMLKSDGVPRLYYSRSFDRETWTPALRVVLTGDITGEFHYSGLAVYRHGANYEMVVSTVSKGRRARFISVGE